MALTRRVGGMWLRGHLCLVRGANERMEGGRTLRKTNDERKILKMLRRAIREENLKIKVVFVT